MSIIAYAIFFSHVINVIINVVDDLLYMIMYVLCE